MAIKEIPIKTFLNTQADPEDVDIQGCTALDNFQMDRVGTLTLRKGKKIKMFLDNTDCRTLERIKTRNFGSFFIGYDKSTKKLFRINKL